MTSSALDRLQVALGYKFRNDSLLRQALSHRSVGASNNERLEFLGDSILNFIVADLLFQTFPSAKEGELSRLRSQLVKGDTLAKIAKELDLSPVLLLGEGERKSGGCNRESIQADAVEALLGAIYCEVGLEAVRPVIHRLFSSRMNELSLDDTRKDSKSKLQEWLQGRKLPLPEYIVSDIEGEGHAQVFTISCSIQGTDFSPSASASSRKKAEKMAAKLMLEHLGVQ